MNREREKSILEIAVKEKTVTVKDLAHRLYASEPSIRRDLCSLEKQKLLRRTHGGAVLDESALSDTMIPFLIRELEKAMKRLSSLVRRPLLCRTKAWCFWTLPPARTA